MKKLLRKIKIGGWSWKSSPNAPSVRGVKLSIPWPNRTGKKFKFAKDLVDKAFSELSPEAKKEIRAMEKETFVGASHFGLGLFIRNSYLHGNEHNQNLFTGVMGDVSPDEISGRICEQIWDRVNKETTTEQE